MSFPGYPDSFDPGWWRITQVVPPVQEPITLAEAKAFARVEYPDDDALITDLISSCREYAETFQKRAIPTQVFTLQSMGFPWTGGYYNRMIRSNGPSPWWLPTAQGIIQIPHPMVQMVLSIQYIDPSLGTINYVLPQNYVFSYNSTPGRIQPLYGQVWPLSRPQIDSVAITFVAGYGGTSIGSAQTQTLAVQGVATGGTFTLTFSGSTTSSLNWNCTGAQVQTALQALGSIGAGNATVAGGPFPVAPMIVMFAGTLATGYQPQITATSSLTGVVASQPAVLTNIAPLMPSSTRTAIKQLVADGYVNREASQGQTLFASPIAEKKLQPEYWGSYV